MTGVALSVRQPWASLLVMGIKTVELRNWATSYRGPVIVHASKNIDSSAARRLHLPNMPIGCLIGEAELVSVEPLTPARWEELSDSHLQHGPYPGGGYAWHFDSVRAFYQPVNCVGKLGLFTVTIEEENRVLCSAP